MHKGWLLPLALVLTCLQPLTSAVLTVTSTFSQRGVNGTITFTQASSDGPTVMDISLTGLYNIAGSDSFPWHVHQYPFPHDGTLNPCGAAIVGGHYDPLGAFNNSNYATACSQQTPQDCEIGDISGKFGNFPSAQTVTQRLTDNNLDLYGVYSIIGRSIVIHFQNGSRFVCANIGYPDSPDSAYVLYSPFRNVFTGSIFYRQHSSSSSTASVYTDLLRIMGSTNTTGHNWHVHRDPLDAAGVNCSVAGPHYNPRNVDISESSGYLNRCGSASPAQQRECEIGDLSNKGAPFNVQADGVIKQFYSDTDLPVIRNADGFLINNRSTVIHAENLGGPRIGCANLTSYQPLEAVARFNENGISGSIRFFQRSPYDPTQVFVYLKGLQLRTAGYHVHEYPVGPGTSPQRCANPYTGGHLNPTGIMEAGTTSDQFEVGDLSGKFGSLSGQNNIYREYVDPNVPLFGAFSILDRSIVIHEDDAEGTRFICSNIQRISQVVQVTTPINTDTFSGSVTFSQPSNDPYSETTIVVNIAVQQDIALTANSDGMVEFNWSYRKNPMGATTNCAGLSNLTVFDSTPSLCSTSTQLACEAGDLTGKHGTLLIPQAAASNPLRAVYTDANLPLHTLPGLDSVFGQDRNGHLYITPAGGDLSPVLCAQSNAAALVEAPPTDPTPTDGATPIAQVSSLIVFGISIACVALSVISW